jgi:2-keto-4-pentenoate hydratase
MTAKETRDAPLSRDAILAAARLLWDAWDTPNRIEALPVECRPSSRQDGYAIQAEIARISSQRVDGWKIAATSTAGQRHIGVDSPISGRLLSHRILEPQSTISLQDNLMRVAEPEFAFRFAKDLPARDAPYDVDEVMAAIASIHPAIEVPDSRYCDFARVGAPQLIADNACALWFVLGPGATAPWRPGDLATAPVAAFRNGLPAGTGTGANVMGDPCVALTWIANELRVHADGLKRNDVVTTGASVVPVAVSPGDLVVADFGQFGGISVSFA